MTSTCLAQALHACASGIYTAEAAVGMLIAQATWLDRDDFRRFMILVANYSASPSTERHGASAGGHSGRTRQRSAP
jgi:hypothetical protein